MADDLTPADLDALRQAGRDPDDVLHQLTVLRGPAPRVELVRPCVPGDGILRLEQRDYGILDKACDDASRPGRVASFVPASGAATRMFEPFHRLYAEGGSPRLDELNERWRAGEDWLGQVVPVLELADRLALTAEDPLPLEVLSATGSVRPNAEVRPILERWLTAAGPNFAAMPKGVVPFHVYPDNVAHAPFEEHVLDTMGFKSRYGPIPIEFTVAPGATPLFLARWGKRTDLFAEKLGGIVDIRFSEQSSALDTIAFDEDGNVVRDADGQIAFRPGGHGTLLPNLQVAPGNIVLVRNIDNVGRPGYRMTGTFWRSKLVGAVARLEQKVRYIRAGLAEGRDSAKPEATKMLHEVFGESDVHDVFDALDRPTRVCGMVANDGQPGGGPFWVRHRDGRVVKRIVESAEVDHGNAEQEAIWRSATHFNPVDMALIYRDPQGRPVDLTRYVDASAFLVTEKATGGKRVRVLERPGLWNGAMANWNTLFIEMARDVFNPVKTLADLLGPAHTEA